MKRVFESKGLAVRFVLLIFLASSLVVNVFAANRYLITHEEWAKPKRVETVLQMSAIKNILTEFNKSPASQLLILYPGGDEGTLWAHDLKAWLVSLGLPSQQIELRPGSAESTSIDLQVEPPISGMIP